MFGLKSKAQKEAERKAVAEGLESLFKSLEEATSKPKDSFKAGEELEKIRAEFKPLDLVDGDTVTWRKPSYRNSNIANFGDALEVFHTIPGAKEVIRDNGEVYLEDFTVLVERGGTLHEVALDSRRFM